MLTLERNQIRDIIDRVEIHELVSHRVSLKKSGSSWKGKCPFHNEQTASFYVYPESGKFVCFGCGAKGDAVDWLIETEGMSWLDAMTYLAGKVGIEIDTEKAQLSEQHDTIYRLNYIATKFYHSILVENKYQSVQASGKQGRVYLVNRGLTRPIADAFEIGYAPAERTLLLDYLTGIGYSEEDVLSAGLITKTNDGRIYDRFWGRVVFPIKDKQGRVVGFGGRAIENERKPKYLNSPATPVFDKSALLYGLDQARMSIRRSRTVVLVEGYLDVEMAHQFGHTNVVGTMGTNLTVRQAEMLKSMSERMILAFDSDGAGKMAAIRSIEKLRGKGELYIVVIPDGKDPDGFLRNGGDWEGLLSGAIPFVSYAITTAASACDMGDIRAKSRAIQEIGTLVREIKDSIEQESYIREIARAFDSSDSAVRSAIFNGASLTRTVVATQGEGPILNPVLGQQEEVRDYVILLMDEVRLAEESQDNTRIERALRALQDFYHERACTTPDISRVFSDLRAS
jgi:DNA primase